jgi:integrase
MYRPITISQYRSDKVATYKEAKNTQFIVERSKAGNITKRWEFRYQFNNKRRKRTLSPSTLEQDRKILQQWRDLLASGIDPLEAKSAIRPVELSDEPVELKSPSFRSVAKSCELIRMANSRAGRWSNKFVKRLENYAYPKIGNVPIDEVNRDSVLAVIKPLWGTKNPTAQKLLTDIKYVLGYAISEGLREPGNDPTQWSHNLEFKLPAANRVHQKKHHASMPYDRIPSFIEGLNGIDSVSAYFVHFTILTGIRNGTVRKSEWREFDFNNLVWNIPETKNGRPFTVPLTEQMLNVLTRLAAIREQDFVFYQDRDPQKPVSENCGTSHLKKVWGLEGVTMHGFRSTLSTYLNQQEGLDPRIIDACIEHRMGSEIELSYNRSEWLNKRRSYMQVWNDFCWSYMDAQ